jgi:hypothetical protein
MTVVPFVPIGEWRWLQRTESASLIGLPVISIPTAPTKVCCFQSLISLGTLQSEQRFDHHKMVSWTFQKWITSGAKKIVK